jgi:WhiB family redox-sensing transcriptional regulator
MRNAACATEDPAVFFPTGNSDATAAQVAVAKAICARCPVREDCLDFALLTNQQYGVWGGMDEDERRALRRSWRQ